MAKEDAPTLFQVNGPVGLNNWKTYCYDLSGSDFYGELTSEDYALKEGDEVLGVAYVIESYGIIVNKALLEQAGYTVDDIQSFEDLKAVAEDITARKDELGFAAFTSAGMESSSDWRFKTHLANLPDLLRVSGSRHFLHRRHRGHLPRQLPRHLGSLHQQRHLRSRASSP